MQTCTCGRCEWSDKHGQWFDMKPGEGLGWRGFNRHYPHFCEKCRDMLTQGGGTYQGRMIRPHRATEAVVNHRGDATDG